MRIKNTMDIIVEFYHEFSKEQRYILLTSYEEGLDIDTIQFMIDNKYSESEMREFCALIQHGISIDEIKTALNDGYTLKQILQIYII